MATSDDRQQGDRLDRFTAALIDRYGSIAVPGAAVLLVALGVGMVTSPDGYYGSPLYRFLYSGVLIPPMLGAVYLTVGLAALIRPCRPTVAALIATHVGWGLACLYAAITVDGVSPTAWAYPLIVAVILVLSVRAQGYDRATRR